MENFFTQSTFKRIKSSVSILIGAVLLVFNSSAIGKKNDGDEGRKKLLPPPTPTIVLTPPTGTSSSECNPTLTASGCDAGNTVMWYIDGNYAAYFTGATIRPYIYIPVNLSAKCRDEATQTSGSESAAIRVFPTAYTEIIPRKIVQFICPGSSVTFNASSATAGLTYKWRIDKPIPDNERPTGSSYTAVSTPDESNYYSVDASFGACTYYSKYVVVINNTKPIISSSFSGACGDKTLTLECRNVYGGTFQWKLNGTNISGATTSLYSLPLASATGSYTVEYTDNGCVTTSSPFVFSPPTLTLVPAVSPACNATLIATGCPFGDNSVYIFYKYNPNSTNWEYTGETYGSRPYTFPVGTIPIEYRVNCYGGTFCEELGSNTVKAVPNNFTQVVPTTATICSVGGSATLNASSAASGLTYQWKLNGSTIAGATNSTYNATAAGNYTVTATGGNCSFNSNSSMVSNAANPLNVSITSTQNSPATINNGQSLILTSNGCISVGGTVTWSDGATTNAITVTPSSSSTYTFTCTKPPCVVMSSAFVVNVNNPLLPPTMTSSSLTTCAGTSVTITGTCPSGSAISWNTSPVQTTAVINVNPSVTTSYIATCTAGAATSNASMSIGVFNDAITSVSSGNWTDPSVWSCNCVPASCNDVTVETGHHVVIPVTITGILKNLKVKGIIDVKNSGMVRMK